MRFKRTFTEPVPQTKEDGLRKEGIATFHGPARFAGPNSLEVSGQLLEARYIVIATGAKPASLGITGEDLITISEQFLELETLPAEAMSEFEKLFVSTGKRIYRLRLVAE